MVLARKILSSIPKSKLEIFDSLYMYIYGRCAYTCVYMGFTIFEKFAARVPTTHINRVQDRSTPARKICKIYILDTWRKILNWLSEELHIGAIPCK